MGPLDPSNPNFPVYLKMMRSGNGPGRRPGGCTPGCGCLVLVVLTCVIFIVALAIGAR